MGGESIPRGWAPLAEGRREGGTEEFEESWGGPGRGLICACSWATWAALASVLRPFATIGAFDSREFLRRLDNQGGGG